MTRRFEILKQLFLIIIAFSNTSALNQPNPCLQVKTEHGINCECTDEYCDTLYVPMPESGNHFVMVTSSEEGDRFSYENGYFSTLNDSEPSIETNVLLVDPTEKSNRSEIIGFGGAWTGSVRYILNHFSQKLKEHFYNSYYSRDGFEYNLLRTSIGGVDYDILRWTYDMQTEPDPLLLNFTELNGFDKLKNSQIKEMIEITNNSNINVLAAAWSPPLWMKANGKWHGSANNRLLPEYYKAFADYHGRWLNLTMADGISISSISTGNEPVFAVNHPCGMPGMSWDPENQADWMVNYLMPSLQQTGFEVKVHVLDDMRNASIEYLDKMTQRQPDMMNYADFIAMHPYFDSETSPEILDLLHQKYEKPILYTEMTFGVDGERRIMSGSWEHAEEFTMLLIEALQYDVAGYVDWNLMLDSRGGPAYVNGGIDAPILAKDDFSGFYKQPSFYAMGHFAKFISRHSLRIRATFSGPERLQVQTVAYHRCDNTIVIILYNNGTDSVDFTLTDHSKGETEITLKPKSVNTIYYSNK